MNTNDMMNRHHGKAAGAVKVILWIYSACTFLILGYLIYQSLRPKREVLTKTFGAPKQLSFDNYVRLIRDEHFFHFLETVWLFWLPDWLC